MVWPIVWYIVVAVIGELLKPKPTYAQNAKASRGPVNMPVVLSTKPITVICGKGRLRDPSIIWYGDFQAIPITQNGGRGGLFGLGSTHWVTVGHKYKFGVHLALCHGSGVKLHKVWMDETLVYGATEPVITSGEFTIDKEGIYGGESSGGGISAICEFFPGTSALASAYLEGQSGVVPSYLGVATLLWKGPSTSIPYDEPYTYYVPTSDTDPTPVAVTGVRHLTKGSGYIGTSPTPHPISVELSRYPCLITPLSVTKSIIGADSNPVEFMLECLTTDPNGADGWGMGFDITTMIDMPSFRTAADTCYAEGLGITVMWDQQGPIEELVADICRAIDAVCYRDFHTGLYKIKLIRGGYVIGSLPVLDVSNVVSIENFAQGSIDGTVNEVKINFLDRLHDYQSTPAQAQDTANMRAQGEVISSTTAYDCICDNQIADRLAYRELLALSTPLASAEVIVNRSLYSYGPGDLFVFNWEPLGISNLVMRVQKCSVGMPLANKIRMTLIQDVFSLGSANYSAGGGSTWSNPITAPAVITSKKLFELPWFFGESPELMICAARPNLGATCYEVWKNGSSPACIENVLGFTPTGTLVSPYTSKHTVDTSSVVIAGGGDLSIANLSSATPGEISGSRINLAVIEGTVDEYIAFENFTDNLDGTYTLSNIWGGLFDTLPSYHVAGSRVWFFALAASNPDVGMTPFGMINIRLVSKSSSETTLFSDASDNLAVFTNRVGKMLPPGGLAVNGAFDTISTTPIAGDAIITWEHRNRNTINSTTVIKQDASGNPTAEGSYTIKIYTGGTLRHTITSFTLNTYTYSLAMRLANSLWDSFVCRVNVTQASYDGAADSSRSHEITFTMNKMQVISRTIAAEPVGVNGDAYIIPVGATGTNWTGQDKKVGYYSTAGGWVFYMPSSGWQAIVTDEGGATVTYNGTIWV